jgi:hypothetical protein
MPIPALARWLLGLGIVASLAANIAHGLNNGLTGAVVVAWPAVALVGLYELLVMVIRDSQAAMADTAKDARAADPLQEQATGAAAGVGAGGALDVAAAAVSAAGLAGVVAARAAAAMTATQPNAMKADATLCLAGHDFRAGVCRGSWVAGCGSHGGRLSPGGP